MNNRIQGDPIRWPRTLRDAFPFEQRENAAGIEGPPVVHVNGWRWLVRDLWHWIERNVLINKE